MSIDISNESFMEWVIMGMLTGLSIGVTTNSTFVVVYMMTILGGTVMMIFLAFMHFGFAGMGGR